MAGAGLVPQAIVLALGAGALGGPDALRLLLQFAGRISPAVDLAICVVVISLLTAPLLGTILLARFVRKAGPGGGTAPATDLFAHMTAMVSVGAAFLVTACLLLVPGGAVRLPIDFAVNNPIAVTVLAICAAFAAPLRARFFRGAGSAGGPAPAAAPATTIKFLAVAAMSLVASFVASGGFDALLLFPEFHWCRCTVTLPVGVAIAIVTVAGTTLLVWCSRRARIAAGAGGGAAARTS